MTFTFNGIEPKEKLKKDESITYGPLSPGIYEVEVKLTGKYGKGKVASELFLADTKGTPSWIDVDLPLGNTGFRIENYSSASMKDVHILINDEKIPVDEDGETAEIGPILMDGSQQAKVTVVSVGNSHNK